MRPIKRGVPLGIALPKEIACREERFAAIATAKQAIQPGPSAFVLVCATMLLKSPTLAVLLKFFPETPGGS